MQISSIKSSYNKKKNPAFGVSLTYRAGWFFEHSVLAKVPPEQKITADELKILRGARKGYSGDVDGKNGSWEVTLTKDKDDTSIICNTLRECYNFLMTAEVPEAGKNIPAKTKQIGYKTVLAEGQVFDITV